MGSLWLWSSPRLSRALTLPLRYLVKTFIVECMNAKLSACGAIIFSALERNDTREVTITAALHWRLSMLFAICEQDENGTELVLSARRLNNPYFDHALSWYCGCYSRRESPPSVQDPNGKARYNIYDKGPECVPHASVSWSAELKCMEEPPMRVSVQRFIDHPFSYQYQVIELLFLPTSWLCPISVHQTLLSDHLCSSCGETTRARSNRYIADWTQKASSFMCIITFTYSVVDTSPGPYN